MNAIWKVLKSFFTNREDGIYGDNRWPHAKDPDNWLKAVRWWIRNPAHDFCFRVIGLYDKKQQGLTKSVPGEIVFKPGERTFLLGYIQYKWLRLPFISWTTKNWCGYIGHRLDSGAWGCKLRRR